MPIMILGNYLSATAGFFLVPHARTIFSATLYDGASIYQLQGLIRKTYWVSVAFTFVLTLIIEWPFCYWAIGNTARRLSRSLGVNLIIQTASYTCLLGLASRMGNYELFTEVTFDPNVVREARHDVTVFYLSADTGDLRRIRLDGQERREVAPLGLTGGFHDLHLRRDGEGGPWQLCLDRGRDKRKVLVSDVRLAVAPEATYTYDRLEGGKQVTEIHNLHAYTLPVDYRSADDREWDLRVWWWQGLQASNRRTGQHFKVCLDTAVGTWPVQFGTVLSGNRVVFEMADQILLLDLASRRLGVITRGNCPVVVVHGSAPSTTSSHSSGG